MQCLKTKWRKLLFYLSPTFWSRRILQGSLQRIKYNRWGLFQTPPEQHITLQHTADCSFLPQRACRSSYCSRWKGEEAKWSSCASAKMWKAAIFNSFAKTINPRVVFKVLLACTEALGRVLISVLSSSHSSNRSPPSHPNWLWNFRESYSGGGKS